MLVDANVWSELTRPRPDANVIRFLADNSERLVLSTIVLAELEFGVANAKDPAHRERLISWLESILARCGDRVLEPDLEAAAVWGKLKAQLKREGRPIADFDLMIAAQAIAAGMALASRNRADMERTGVSLVNPWEDGGSNIS